MMDMYVYDVFFFKQKTAYEMRISDWSSDVCSSDLSGINVSGCGQIVCIKDRVTEINIRKRCRGGYFRGFCFQPEREPQWHGQRVNGVPPGRSEERRVGKECGQYV